jgi:hypothetical protein
MAESATNLLPVAAAPGELPARDDAKPPQANPFGRKKGEPTAEELLANINRALPFSDEAEKGVLSSLLQDPNERLGESRITLAAAAFYHEANRTIYEKLLEFHDKNLPIDPVMVTNVLRDQNLLDRVGGRRRSRSCSPLFRARRTTSTTRRSSSTSSCCVRSSTPARRTSMKPTSSAKSRWMVM